MRMRELDTVSVISWRNLEGEWNDAIIVDY
jgi:hypothetical protein